MNDIDINHAGVTINIQGSVTQGVLQGINSVIDDDRKKQELLMRKAAETVFR